MSRYLVEAPERFATTVLQDDEMTTVLLNCIASMNRSKILATQKIKHLGCVLNAN